jgi:Family of unknown function (DUF6152)
MRINLPLLMTAALAWGHHSFSAQFDANKPVTLKGKVTQMDWMNPHAWIHLNVPAGEGKTSAWMIETGSPNILLHRGFTKKTLEAGTEIIVQGYLAKNGENTVNGGTVTFKDGKKLFVGSSNLDEPPDREKK